MNMKNYFVYEVEKDGTFDFNGDWVDNLDSYEVQFNEDFNSDEVIDLIPLYYHKSKLILSE